MAPCAVIGCKLKQNDNEGCNSCASLAALVLSFIACCILLVIAALMKAVLEKTLDDVKHAEDQERDSYALMRLSQRRQVVGQKLSRVRQQLAESSKVLKSSRYKPVGDWISAPSPNFVAMATSIGPTTFCMVPLNRPSPKTP